MEWIGEHGIREEWKGFFMTQPTERYPLDFDALKKGDGISREKCESILRVSATDDKYGLKLLALKETVVRGLENRGLPVTVVCDHGGLKILTDEEAAEYNPIQFTLGLQKAAQAHRRTMLVDQSGLTVDARKSLDRRIEIQGKVLQAVSETRKTLTAEPHRRIT